jgi:hypothetical protein
MHIVSGTLEGGPYGMKWPILFLAFLVGCAISIRRGNTPTFPHGTRAEFLPRDLEQLNDIAALWRVEVERTAQRLEASYLDRALSVEGMRELTEGQNINSVLLKGPDREASEWEVSNLYLHLNEYF